MDTQEFVNRVRELSGLGDRSEAKRATVAAFAVLRAAISPEEAHDLGSQLPKDFRDLVWSRRNERTPAKRIDMQSLVNQVRSVLSPGHRDRARQVTESILATLREAVSPGELEDIVAELPPELQRKLQPV